MAIFVNWQNWLWSLGGMAVAVFAGLAAHALILVLAKRFASRRVKVVDDFLIKYADRPSRFILPLLALVSVLGALPLPATALDALRHIAGLGLIASVAWLLIATVEFLQELVVSHHAIDVTDNLSARRIRTQIQVLRQILVGLIGLLTVAIMLMTFPSIRHLGESLFASAGLAALMVGLAARTALTNILAGIQIALSQPIRLGDVVIVENEWGWIEEITTTYVVVRIWDLRRLIVPLSYFIEKPFQNWTHTTADLLGTVFVYTDYRVEVEEVRSELLRILQSSGMWDGKVWALQVTNATDRSLELRALMSAPDAPKAWDLRCYVREKLIEFLQQRFPESLPRTRAELGSSSMLSEKGDRPQAA